MAFTGLSASRSESASDISASKSCPHSCPRLLAVAVSACRIPHGDQWYAQKPYKEECRAGRTGVGRYCCAKEPSGRAAEVTGLAASRLLAIAVSACRMPQGVSSMLRSPTKRNPEQNAPVWGGTAV